jgi:ABC-2 type transport system ATP-binding protein
VLTLTDLGKRYGDLVALDGLSLKVERGEVFGLLGPNGAGKSTTVSLAVGLLPPDHGEIQIGDGGAPTSPAVRTQIGLAPQSLAVYEQLTGEENLRFFCSVYGLTGKKREERVDWCLDFVGLGERRGDRVKTYSGGMKRRLNLAVALIHDPDLLLMDEPTVGVDPQSRNAIFDNIEALRDRGRTVVYTTHYMEEAERLCDRVGIIDHGKLLAVDTVDGLIDQHGGSETLIAEVDGKEIRVEAENPLEHLNELGTQGKLGRFRLERPTLEDVFLNLTGRRLRD